AHAKSAFDGPGSAQRAAKAGDAGPLPFALTLNPPFAPPLILKTAPGLCDCAHTAGKPSPRCAAPVQQPFCTPLPTPNKPLCTIPCCLLTGISYVERMAI